VECGLREMCGVLAVVLYWQEFRPRYQ
jgi:hypothetical protein